MTKVKASRATELCCTLKKQKGTKERGGERENKNLQKKKKKKSKKTSKHQRTLNINRWWDAKKNKTLKSKKSNGKFLSK